MAANLTVVFYSYQPKKKWMSQIGGSVAEQRMPQIQKCMKNREVKFDIKRNIGAHIDYLENLYKNQVKFGLFTRHYMRRIGHSAHLYCTRFPQYCVMNRTLLMSLLPGLMSIKGLVCLGELCLVRLNSVVEVTS